jgi:hypothetical protein
LEPDQLVPHGVAHEASVVVIGRSRPSPSTSLGRPRG